MSLLVLVTCFILISNFPYLGADAKPLSFSVQLTHRDSPLSPFYNRSSTPAERLRAEALRSMQRANHFLSLLDQSAIQSVLLPEGGAYVMKISVGTPPTEFLAIADTGSDLIWLRCDPCDRCLPADAPLFKPQSSSTYKQLSCNTDSCQALPQRQHTCGNDNTCVYVYVYGDRSFTRGILSTDTFTFDSGAGKTASFPASVFGCGHNNQGRFTSKDAGLVGLGGGPLSLVSQLGPQIDHRFSYCLVPRGPDAAAGKLSFGSDAVIGEGAVSTALIRKTQPTFYYLNLEGISVGQNTARPASTGGNIIIDSGTTLTILEQSLYDQLEAAVKEAVGAETEEDPSGTFSLCYGGETARGVRVPEMVFHFTGADVRLKAINTFGVVDESGMVCMLIVPSERLSIFGNFAQINFEVVYDLQGEKVSFAPADCTAASS